MTDKKISELTALAGADMQATDEIIVARPGTANYSMTRQEFLNSSDALLQSSLTNVDAVQALADRSFATRAAAVTEWAAMVARSETPPAGTVWTWPDVAIRYDGSTTTVTGFSGWTTHLYAKAHTWDLVGDGATDNTAALAAIRDYCTATGWPVYIDKLGTYMTDTLVVNTGQRLDIRSDIGERGARPTFKLNSSQNDNVLSVTGGTSEVVLIGVGIDGNKANQTAGHGLRSGGASLIHLERVDFLNVYNYGVGYQAGTTVQTYMHTIYLKNIGNDGMDLKDYDSANGVYYIRDVYAEDWGVDKIDKPIIDVRGEADIDGVYGVANNDCVGVRLRDSSAQGRAGAGLYRNIHMRGNGTDTTKVFNIESSEGNWNAANIYAYACSLALIQQSGAVGGLVSNLVTRESHGDGVSIGGSYLAVNGADLENNGSTAYCFDIESTAVSPVLRNWNATNRSTAQVHAGRIATGATNVLITGDMRISHPTTVGGTNGIGDSGTSSVLTDVRGYLI